MAHGDTGKLYNGDAATTPVYTPPRGEPIALRQADGTYRLKIGDVAGATLLSDLPYTSIDGSSITTGQTVARMNLGTRDFLSTLGGQVIFYDDFNRSDRSLAYFTEGENAPSGHQWTADGAFATDSHAYIDTKQLKWGDETSFGGTPIRIAGAQLGRTPTAIASEFVFTAGSTIGQNAVLGACPTSFALLSVQFAVFPDHWSLFITKSTDFPIITLLDSGTFATQLPTDGVTRIKAAMRIDLQTSTVVCEVEGEVVTTFVDSRFAERWGNRVCIQYRKVASTDGAVRFTNVAAATPQPATTGLPAALSFPYAQHNYAGATPPSNIGGALEVRYSAQAAGSWVGSNVNVIVGQWGNSFPNHSWADGVLANGKPVYYLSRDGSETVTTSCSAILPDNTAYVKRTYDAVSGDVKWYTSPDDTTYTQLGSTANVASGGAPWAAPRTVPVLVGSRGNSSTVMFGGTISLVRIYATVGGTLVAQPDFRTHWGGSSWFDTLGNLWHLNGSWSWLVTEAAVQGLPAHIAALQLAASTPPVGSALSLPTGGTSWTSTPTPASWTLTDLDIRCFVAPAQWVSAANQGVIGSQDAGITDKGWHLQILTSGRLCLGWSTNGTSNTLTNSTVDTPGAVDGRPLYLRVTFDVDNGGGSGTVNFYTSADGVTWGSPYDTKTTTGTAALHKSAHPIYVGIIDGSASPFAGLVSWAEVRSTIGGTVVAGVDYRTKWTGTDAQGNVWTIAGTTWSWVLPESAVVNLVADLASIRSTVGAPNWAASTVYLANQLVMFGGLLYRANASFTSGASFVAANWTLVDQVASSMLTSGEATMRREGVSSNVVVCLTGVSRFTYFTARKTETITQIRSMTGAVAAAATPTICRIGIHTVDPSTGDLTMVASTPNDTALWAATNTEYVKSLSASWSKVAGVLYAIEYLCVSAGATPQFPGQMPVNSVVMNAIMNRAPSLAARKDSRTDLTSTVTFATLQPSSCRIYAELLP